MCLRCTTTAQRSEFISNLFSTCRYEGDDDDELKLTLSFATRCIADTEPEP